MLSALVRMRHLSKRNWPSERQGALRARGTHSMDGTSSVATGSSEGWPQMGMGRVRVHMASKQLLQEGDRVSRRFPMQGSGRQFSPSPASQGPLASRPSLPKAPPTSGDVPALAHPAVPRSPEQLSSKNATSGGRAHACDEYPMAKGPPSRCGLVRDAVLRRPACFVFLPLAFGFWWAVCRSHGFERAAWVGLFALSAGEWAWQVTYPSTEGDSPTSWIVALTSGLIPAGPLARAADYTLSRNVGS